MERQITTYVLIERSLLKAKINRLASVLIEVVGGVVLLALGARISFITPFTPVPFTLQTLFLTYLILLLGKRAWRTATAYVVLGLIGLPVFAYGGGLFYVLSPTFGYLLGFIVASIVVGRNVLRYLLSHYRYLIGTGLVQLIIYTCGMLWLTAWLILVRSMNPLEAIYTSVLVGVAPFIAWDIAKAYMALALYVATIKIHGKLSKTFHFASNYRT